MLFDYFLEIIKFIVNFNYKIKLNYLKSKGKINVVFLVSENQKWSYDNLYAELKNNDKFNVRILISYPKDLKLNDSDKAEFIKRNCEFYSKIDKDAEIIYKNNKYTSLKKYKPDIVFYEQQWGLPRKYKPYLVSFYALTYFSCYGIQMFDYKQDYTKIFHYFLFRYLVDSKQNFLRFKSYDKKFISNCVVAGYPKLDYYLSHKLKNNLSTMPTIIYAPHHSFFVEPKMATFDKNGEFILDLAKKTKDDFNWVFKPHPRLFSSLVSNNIMLKEDVENYYSQWKNIGSVFDSGNYFDLFLNSDLLITDCCSYLGEYYYTNNPVIRLVSEKSIKLNSLGSEITKNYFSVCSNEELQKVFFDIVGNIEKYKRNCSMNSKISSSRVIAESILKLIK